MIGCTLARLIGVAMLAGCVLAPSVANAAPVGGTILLTNADNGVTRTVPPGETVVVQLTGKESTGNEWRWSAPAASDPSVLRLDAEGRVGLVTTAVYTAERQGTSSITSTEGCTVTAPGYACPAYVLLWQANVNVLLVPTV